MHIFNLWPPFLFQQKEIWDWLGAACLLLPCCFCYAQYIPLTETSFKGWQVGAATVSAVVAVALTVEVAQMKRNLLRRPIQISTACATLQILTAFPWDLPHWIISEPFPLIVQQFCKSVCCFVLHAPLVSAVGPPTALLHLGIAGSNKLFLDNLLSIFQL